MKVIMEYIVCYSGAFTLGVIVGTVVTYWIQSEIHQDDIG